MLRNALNLAFAIRRLELELSAGDFLRDLVHSSVEPDVITVGRKRFSRLELRPHAVVAEQPFKWQQQCPVLPPAKRRDCLGETFAEGGNSIRSLQERRNFEKIYENGEPIRLKLPLRCI